MGQTCTTVSEKGPNNTIELLSVSKVVPLPVRVNLYRAVVVIVGAFAEKSRVLTPERSESEIEAEIEELIGKLRG